MEQTGRDPRPPASETRQILRDPVPAMQSLAFSRRAASRSRSPSRAPPSHVIPNSRYTKEKGMPFDAEAVRRHYAAMCESLGKKQPVA